MEIMDEVHGAVERWPELAHQSGVPKETTRKTGSRHTI